MRYRTLGRTGLKVSEIGYGGEHITDADMTTTREVLETALAGGVNIIDVFMPQPEVRSHMGDALRARRKDVILQGHIGATLVDGQYNRAREPKLCDEFIQDFLTRFHTDYIDIGMMHFIDSEEDYKLAFETEYLDYVRKLKREGVIRFVGVSSHNAVTARKMAESGEIDVLMFSVNAAFDLLPPELTVDELFEEQTYVADGLRLDPDRAALYRACEEKGVGITSMKTLAAGRLLNAQASPFGAAMTVNQCVSYVLQRPAVASVLLGAKSREEMLSCLAYEDASDAEKDYASVISRARGAVAGRCMYCNHCLPCPSEIDIAAVTKLTDLAANGASDTLRAHYAALDKRAGDCVECGACESRCPFSVDVRANMRLAKSIFGA